MKANKKNTGMVCTACNRTVTSALAIAYPEGGHYFVCMRCCGNPNMIFPDRGYVEWLMDGGEVEWVSPEDLKRKKEK